MPNWMGKWTGTGVEPLDFEADRLNYRFNDLIRITSRMPRNSDFNAKLRVLTHLMHDNQSFIQDYDRFVDLLKIEAGFCYTIIDEYGRPHYIPKSLAFDICPEEQARWFYYRLIDIAVEKYSIGPDGDQVDALVDQYLGFV